jgi:AraC-like DNA-binding protein/mannose-6-phosphate isomerase-like protein (cupin superfamily)
VSRYYYGTGSTQPSAIRDTAKLLNVASYKYGGDWKPVPHAHKHTELFFIVSGKGQFIIQDQVFPVNVNNLVIINPNVLHTEASMDAQPLEYIVLGIEGVEMAANDHYNGQFCILDHFESVDISSCLRNILREMERKNPGYEDICQAYTEILTIRLMRSIAISPQAEAQVVSGNQQCATVKRYIDLHFKESLTLEQLAEEAHMNKYYLSHAFKQEYGISPINYLISRRIEESKYLLSETDLSMSQIAHILGFSSLSYFSQVFRKAHGTSPMDFRQTSKKL